MLWIVECRRKDRDGGDWKTDLLTPNEDKARQWECDQAERLPDYDWRTRILTEPDRTDDRLPPHA